MTLEKKRKEEAATRATADMWRYALTGVQIQPAGTSGHSLADAGARAHGKVGRARGCVSADARAPPESADRVPERVPVPRRCLGSCHCEELPGLLSFVAVEGLVWRPFPAISNPLVAAKLKSKFSFFPHINGPQ